MAQAVVGVVLVAALTTFLLLNLDEWQLPAVLPSIQKSATSVNVPTRQVVQLLPTRELTPTGLPATVTVVPSPASLASPAILPSPTTTDASPTTTPPTLVAPNTIAPTPVVVAALPQPIGVLRLRGREVTRADSFTLEVGQAKLPPAGSHYELWLLREGDVQLNLGPLRVEQGAIWTAGSRQENLLAAYDQALITIERDNDPATRAATVAFTSQWPADFANHLRQLMVGNGDNNENDVNNQGLFVGATEQIQLAITQGERLQAALANADVQSARQSVESIINILEGEQSATYGDKDGDGQTQTPGNGFGIRPYLASIHEQLLLVEQSAVTTELRFYTQRAAALVEHLLAVAAEATAQALPLVTLQQVDEIQPLAIELHQLLVALLDGIDHDENGVIDPLRVEGGIQAAHMLARTLAQYPFFSTAESSAAGSIVTVDGLPKEVGALWFADPISATAPAGATGDEQASPLLFTLTLAYVYLPPAGYHYELWLGGGENMPPRQLGRLMVEDGYVRLSGETEQDPFADAGDILLSIEADNDAEPERVGEILYVGNRHSAALHSSLTQLLRDVDGDVDGAKRGLLTGSRAQLLLAADRTALMQEALAIADLDEVRSLAEYVIHALDGKDPSGDLNGDGQLQMSDDPVGVRAYLESARIQMVRVSALITATDRTRFYTARALATHEHSLGLIQRATDKAYQIFSVDTIGEMQPIIAELEQRLETALYGADRDGNGVIDPMNDEGAILALFAHVARMGEYTIHRRDPG